MPRSLTRIQDVLNAELALGPTPTKSYLSSVQEPNSYLEEGLSVCEVFDFSFRFAFEEVESAADYGSGPLFFGDHTVDEVDNRAMILVKLHKFIGIALATITSGPARRLCKV